MNTKPGRIIQGELIATGLRFGIVCARFNDLLVSHLLDGAMDTIVRHGGAADDITLAWVPGSFEIPMVAQALAKSGKCDAVIALGMVIQGATAHAQHINSQVSAGISAVSRETGIPVIYGVVTVESLEQAMERSGTKAGNRGSSAATAAIEMANLTRQLKQV